MSRIWKGEGWEVREGKWQDSPPEQVDHVITDPPYSAHVHKHLSRADLGRGITGEKEATFAALASTPALELIPKAHRWVICWCAAEQLGVYEADVGGQWSDGGSYVRPGFWRKLNGPPQFSGDRPAMPGEHCAIMHARGQRLRWNNGGHHAFWEGSSTKPDERIHETQKPLWLMMELVKQFTDPGDLVWDPYGGSMTTGVACLRLGRRFLGHEMQAHYAEQGAERLKAAERGQTLSEYKSGQQALFT